MLFHQIACCQASLKLNLRYLRLEEPACSKGAQRIGEARGTCREKMCWEPLIIFEFLMLEQA